jgi:hypothetical protein
VKELQRRKYGKDEKYVDDGEEVKGKLDLENENSSIIELVQCLAIGIAFRRKFCSDPL